MTDKTVRHPRGPFPAAVPGRVAARLHACGPCGEDFEGLLVAVRGVTD